MTPEQAAKIEASRCKMTPGQPLHVTRDLFVDHVETKARVGDTLRWLRQYLGDGTDDLVQVPAREVWNRLTPRYFDPRQTDPDEEVGS